jgi:hypothetical protein
MANDPYFSSRFLAQNTAGAPEIYNEALSRFAAGFGTIVSDTLFAPPMGTPNDFDAYYIREDVVAEDEWEGWEGMIAIYRNGWAAMPVKPGMRFMNQDGKRTMDVVVTAAGQIVTAIDGEQAIVPYDSGGGVWHVDWDVSRGTAATVTLANDTWIQAPTNMVPGRRYHLRVVQDVIADHDLRLATNVWASNFGTAPAIAKGSSEVSDLTIIGPQAPFNVPCMLGVFADTEVLTS